MDSLDILAKNMKRFRKQRHMTQGELSDLCGLHRTYLGGIEQKRINVSLANITKIADALGVRVSDLLAEEPPTADAVRSAAASAANVTRIGDYALCDFSGDDIEVSPLDMADPDLGVQILISLIQEGITDEDELAKKYKETERVLLRYLKSQ